MADWEMTETIPVIVIGPRALYEGKELLKGIDKRLKLEIDDTVVSELFYLKNGIQSDLVYSLTYKEALKVGVIKGSDF